MTDVVLPRSKMRPLAVASIVVVVLCALGGAGYYLYNTVGGPKVRDSTFKQVTDPLVRKHLVAQANQPLQRIETTFSDRKEKTTLEIDLSSSRRLASHATIVNGNDRTSELIIIGTDYFVKDQADGKWWLQTLLAPPSDENGSIASFDPAQYKAQLTSLTSVPTYTKQGEEDCGTLRCYKYEAKINNTLAAIIWFDTSQLLLRKSVSTSSNTTRNYTYDNIAIMRPDATKNVPSGKKIFEYLGSQSTANDPTNVLTDEQLQQIKQAQQSDNEE